MVRRRLVSFASLVLVACLVAPAAFATPVSKTEDEYNLYGRAFLEPAASTNYMQFGEGGHGEFEWGFQLLEKLFPRYIEITTVADELNDKNAVSVGADGVPAWDPADTGDGLPLHVVIATDSNVPDRKKEYIVIAAGHSGEPCGREGGARFMEDVVTAAANGSEQIFDNATGLTDKTFEMTASQILKRTKIYFISPSPDGWLVGDGYGAEHSQYNGANINSNRIGYSDGWSFPRSSILFAKGYTTYSQPEGISMTKYLTEVRRKELRGKPFAIGMDMHGPTPLGFILLHDEGLDPEKLQRMVDLGVRVGHNMEETLPIFGPLDSALDTGTEGVRDNAPDDRDNFGTQDNIMWRSQDTVRWGFVTHIVDSFLGYTAAGSWGGFFSSNSGLDAASLSYEINCRPSSPWVGADQQVYADNVRHVLETGVVTTAAWSKMPLPKTEIDGRVGFYESGERVTDKDGNPMPVPKNYPGNPLVGDVKQIPYDVENTDYFRDLKAIVDHAPEEVTADELGSISTFDRFVVPDAVPDNVSVLKDFVEGGGDLILTDAALQLVPQLTDIDTKAVEQGFGYVGYSDLDRSQPLTKGLLATAWQMYAPTPIGIPLLMERDGYWGNTNNPQADAPSPTKNSAPIWTIDRDAWEAAGGTTVGTADPPKDRKSVADGTNQDKTEIGFIKVGEGRLVIFGALLPQPSEAYDHWFGLDAYGVSDAAQKMLLRVLSGKF
ncbi:MAG: hypothetical protein QOG54_1539 [Actinomycetota bacterium]|jgi:hypothetical protein|nr:hypothetical protein [Actinomycetota bacterium]